MTISNKRWKLCIIFCSAIDRIIIRIHFFVEYGAEKRLFNGLPQAEYLNSAAARLNNMGLFDSNTDAIYVLISKIG